jgi:hypothetical protein
MLSILQKYKNYLDKALSYYVGDDEFLKYFNRIPKSRYYTFEFCFSYFVNNNMSTIVELGTSRSYVDGRFEGCNTNNTIYWNEDNPEKWDWSAGCFTRLATICLGHTNNYNLHTVDYINEHIDRCKYMNKDLDKIYYYTSTSEDFLNNFNKKIDFLYLDTGDMTPIEDTAQLHLREANIIVEKNLINTGGIILIDDIRSCVPYQYGENIDLGKGYLSIPYFLNNGFKLIMDEYQTILVKL